MSEQCDFIGQLINLNQKTENWKQKSGCQNNYSYYYTN